MITPHHNLSSGFGKVRNQGARPTCMAFAASDINFYVNKAPGHLSPEFLSHHIQKLTPGWMPSQGFGLNETLAATASPGQPEESGYPYQPANPKAPLKSPPAGVLPLYKSKCKSIIKTASNAIAKIKGGDPIGLLIHATTSLCITRNGIVEYSGEIGLQNHAVIGLGYGDHEDSGEEYFLIRNSWGESWGVNGYGWLSRKFMDHHFVIGYEL